MMDDNNNIIEEKKTKKKSKVVNIILLVLIAGFIGYACFGVFSDFFNEEKEKQKRLDYYLGVGETSENGSYIYKDGGNIDSSNNDVVEIKSDGTVVAKKGGTTTITITKGTNEDLDDTGSKTKPSKVKNDKISEAYDKLKEGESTTITITVDEKVKSVSLNKNDITLNEGDNFQLLASFNPSSATNKKVTWSSSDSNVASVDITGKVIAKKEGTATITVKTNDGNKTSNCVVKVTKKVQKNNIYLSSNSSIINIGDTVVLNPVVSPDSFLVSNIVYKSSNNGVATVDSTGLIRGVSAGNATISLSIPSEGISTNYSITVNKVNVKDIVVSPSTISMKENENVVLKTTINPENATNKKITYSSSDSSVCTVDQSGKVVGVKKGTCNITVSVDGISKTVKATINENIVPVTKVKMSISNATLNVGGTTKVTSSVEPTNATNKTVTYSVNNTKLCTVDNSGNVKAIASGTCTIKATSSNGLETSLDLKINPIKVTKITLDSTSGTINVGSSTTIKIKEILPSNAANKGVTYTSSNTAIATVASDGIVTGKSAGIATITVTAKDGSGIKTSYNVTVKNVKLTSITLSTTAVTLNVGAKEKVTLKSYNPTNATNTGLFFTSLNTAIATVAADGTITGVKEGSTNIIVTAKDGSGVKQTVKVTINKIAVKEVKFSNTNLYVDVGSKIQLTPTISPSTATYKNNITYSSSNTNVAKVDKSGYITGVKEGYATITVSCDGKSNSIVVFVEKVGDKVSVIDIEDYGYNIGDCIILQSTDKNGKKVYGMIDAGKAGGASTSRVKAYIKDKGITEFEWILITHFHGDHYGGLPYFLDAGIKFKSVYMKEYLGYDTNWKSSFNSLSEMRKSRKATFEKFYSKLTSYKANFKYVTSTSNNTFTLGTGFNIKLYNTDNVFKNYKTKCEETQNCNENINTLTAVAINNSKAYYFSGDIQNFPENVNATYAKTHQIVNYLDSAMSTYKLTKIDVFKASHHAISANNPAIVYQHAKPSKIIATNIKSVVTDKTNDNYKPVIDRFKSGGTSESNIYYSGNGTVVSTVDKNKNLGIYQRPAEGCNEKSCYSSK